MIRNRDHFPNSVRHLWIRLTAVWTIAWFSGLLIFGVTTSYLASQYYDQQLDSRLKIQAIAVYGLAFFNEAGQFESELLKYEEYLLDEDTSLWLIEPSDKPVVHLSGGDRLSLATLNSIATEVVESDSELRKSGTDNHGQPYQLLAIPTYEADSLDPRAAIMVVTNPSATNSAKQRLLGWTALLFLILGFAGVILGGLIARWSVNPLAKFLHDREKFLSAAAHELRTPLASIKAVVEAGTAGTEEATKSLNRLSPLVLKATNGMEDLLLYARLDAGRELVRKEPIRLDLLIEVCLPEQHEVKLELEETIIQGDERLLRALIRNLLANALRHATNPQQVSIRLSGKVLIFENDGGGFPEEVIAESKSDQQIVSSTTGSGFGLALVQMIVKLHGGRFKLGNTKAGMAIAECDFNNGL